MKTDSERVRLAQLYSQYGAMLVRVALKIVHSQDLAEDAVQDTFLAAINQKEKFLSKTPIDFKRWSVIVVRSKCIDLLRKRKHYDVADFSDFDIEGVPSDETPFDVQMIRDEDHKQLMGYIAELDAVSRKLLEMKYQLGMSYGEICSELGMTLAQANSHMARTRTKIRDLWEKDGEL